MRCTYPRRQETQTVLKVTMQLLNGKDTTLQRARYAYGPRATTRDHEKLVQARNTIRIGYPALCTGYCGALGTVPVKKRNSLEHTRLATRFDSQAPISYVQLAL